MKIISHRGSWTSEDKKNSLEAFHESFRKNLGTETDIRDHSGRLIISHDPGHSGSITFESFLELIQRHGLVQPIALNIKSDGLQRMVKEQWHRMPYGSFLFDMSIPDMVQSLAVGLPCYTRMSEYEKEPVLLEKCAGVWLDAFESEDWYSNDLLGNLLSYKSVALVSPELHGREYHHFWQRIKPFSDHNGLIICTDNADEAKSFFK